MRRRVNAKPSAQSDGGGGSGTAAAASSYLPDVLPEDRSMTPRAPPRSSGVSVTPASPKPLFSSFNQVNGQTRRTLDLRNKKKLRCIWLVPDEGDQQIVHPPLLDGIHYLYIATSRFGQDVLAKIKRTDTLSVNLEKNGRFVDAVHTYEQSSEMLNRCIQKRPESQDVTLEEIKWLRVDYEIRCVQLVALCMLGARKSDGQVDNTPFLLLKKAEELTTRDGLHYCKKHVQRAAVYQNIANHYKKQKKYQAALQAAEKAVRINEKLPVRDRLPISYFLKACLHGLLNDPSNAGLMYTECLNLSDAQQPAKSAATSRSGASYGREDEQTALETFNILKAATLHNMAIEWANLHMPDQCRDALASAMEVGVNCFPQTHPVVMRILDTYKVMRQSFLFKGDSSSETKPAVTRPSPLPSFIGTDDVTLQKPLPPKSPKFVGDQIADKKSPRVERIQRSVAEVQPLQQRISPQRPPSQSTETAAIGLHESPRRRSAKRPMTTPEMPTGLIGRPLSPGATRTSYVVAMPEDGYAHALGSKHNPHKEHVIAEARMFVARKKAASQIQKLWRSALADHRAQQQQQQAASVHIQSIVRMHHERSKFNQTLEGAKQIQALWRESLVRVRCANQFQSSIQIQSAWRGKNTQKDFAVKRAKAVLIQAVMRGFLARALIANQRASAIAIQSHIRRRINENVLKKTTSAATTINRVFRGMNARKKTIAERELAMAMARDVEAVIDDLLAMVEALAEVMAGIPEPESVDVQKSADDPCANDPTDSALPAEVADESTDSDDETFGVCFSQDPGDEALAPGSPFLDEADAEVAHESSCDDNAPVEAEEFATIIPALAGEDEDTLNPKASAQKPQMVQSDMNEAILGVILSSIMPSNVENVIQAATEDFTSAQLQAGQFSTLICDDKAKSDPQRTVLACAAAEMNEVNEVDDEEVSAEVPAALGAAVEEVETSAAVAAAVVAVVVAVAAVESSAEAEAELEVSPVSVTAAPVPEADAEAESDAEVESEAEAENEADAAVCANDRFASELALEPIVLATNGIDQDALGGASLDRDFNEVANSCQPPTRVCEPLRVLALSEASFVKYVGEGISPSNIEKLNSFSRATPSLEDRVSHWSPAEPLWLGSARNPDERSSSNVIAGTSSTSTMKTLRSMVMGRQRSMSEDYLFELIAQCDGGLEDFEDGLSEVYASIFPDEELRETNFSGSQSQSVDWVSGSYGFGKSSGEDKHYTGSPIHSEDDPSSSSPPRQSDDQSTIDLVSVLDEPALTADKQTESGEELAANNENCAKTGEIRDLPARGPEIGWDPLSQDRSKVVRNVVSLYVYTTLQYALLEALSRLEEGHHS